MSRDDEEWGKRLLLLRNFPVFDPDWPDEVKLNWFKTFDEILNWSAGREIGLAKCLLKEVKLYCKGEEGK